ncbi:MAG: universal stress protein [Solirubrobacterales bacterium]
MPHGIRHVLVIHDGSSSARKALVDAATIADEHDAEISVVALIDRQPAEVGCARCRQATAYWNGVLEEMAQADLAEARGTLGEREPAPRFEIVSGAGPSGVRRAVARFGCDLVLVPARGPFRERLARRVRRRVTASVVAVSAS